MYELCLIFGVALWTGVALHYATRPFASLIHPISAYLFIHLILFVVRPVIAYVGNYQLIYEVFSFQPSLGDKITVLLAVDLALIVFYAVCGHFGDRPFGLLTAPGAVARPRATKGFLLTMAVVIPPSAYVLATQILDRAANNVTMVMDQDTGISINTTGNGYVDSLPVLLMPSLVAIAWMGRYRPWALAPLAVYVLAQASTGGRWPMVIAVGAVAALYMLDTGRRWLSLKIVASVAAVWMLFSTVVLDRGASLRQAIGLRNQTEHTVTGGRPLEGMDYGNMEFFEYFVYAVPKRTGTYDYFTGNLQLFTEPIPRALWKDKPIGAPVKLFNLRDYGTPIGYTATPAGAGWLSAGWLGVVAWTALFAFAYGRLYNWFVDNRHRARVVLSYGLLFALSLQILRDGVLLTVAKTMLFTFAPLLLWIWFDRMLGTAPEGPSGLLSPRAEPERVPSGPEPVVPRSQRKSASPIAGPIPRAWRSALHGVEPAASATASPRPRRTDPEHSPRSPPRSRRRTTR
jgi:hypothetical protein